MAVTITGTVVSGLGKGETFVSLDGYSQQFGEKLGYDPYPGTLNLDLDESLTDELDDLTPIRIDSWTDGDREFGGVSCYPATSMNEETEIPLHLIIPDKTDHDHSTLEFLSEVNLRSEYNLTDGAVLQVKILSA